KSTRPQCSPEMLTIQLFRGASYVFLHPFVRLPLGGARRKTESHRYVLAGNTRRIAMEPIGLRTMRTYPRIGVKSDVARFRSPNTNTMWEISLPECRRYPFPSAVRQIR